MKQYKKFLWAAVTGALLLSSCADEFDADFSVTKPEDLARYEYLNVYDHLKTYIDRAQYPNFKLGAGTTVSEFLDLALVHSVRVANFDEMTAGNAMKYSSVVDNTGAMDFSQVVKFVSAARNAGLSIHGHTLLWHAQQNNTYLNGLIADDVIEVDPDEKVEVEDAFEDYSKYTTYPFYVMSLLPIINEEGQLEITNPEEGKANWQEQYFVADGVAATVGNDYKVTALIRGSSDGSLDVNMGDWGAVSSASLRFTTEWKEVEVTLKSVPAASSFVVFQSGAFVGTIQVKWLKVTHTEAPATSWWTSLITNGDAEGDDVSCFYATEQELGGGPKAATIGAPGTGADGVGRAFVVQSANNPPEDHSTQFFVKSTKQLKEGDKYKFSMKYRAAKPAECSTQSHNNPGDYLHWQMLVPTPNFTTEWQETSWTGTITDSQAGTNGMNTIAFNLSVLKEANTYYFDDIVFEVEESGNTIPKTPEEKKEILTTALEEWIAGMMDACDDYVKSWDVVNEPMDDGDPYALKSDPNKTDRDNFYWQDYLGKEYAREAIKFARQYGGDDLKLFINDYNLEATYNNNAKCEGLIEMIKYWESDGVTKIDGIGTQMHVSYNMDPEKQKKQEDCIVKMYELMVATGKLVKVTELDMGILDESGTAIKTPDLTFEQEQLMADFYTFIVQKYLEIVPVDQQAGITHWSPTHSPEGSGWRAGEPIGLWDINYNRKPMYEGFIKGLTGEK